MFSRLLYPNPVCFLCKSLPTTEDTPPRSDVNKNVMVLSWLTPTNNAGRFMFSINKSRYSASLLVPSTEPYATPIISECNKRTQQPQHAQTTCSAQNARNDFQVGVEFTLSVPTRGMEQIVLDTGSVSGRNGSKFPSTRCKQNNNTTATNEMNDKDDIEKLTNRQRKTRIKIQRKQQLLEHGVEGLVPIPLGSSADYEPQHFAIKGTVAHIKCRTYAVIGSPPVTKTSTGKEATGLDESSYDHHDIQAPVIDDDHLLIMAEITDAYVHRSYWDTKKLIFRPLGGDVPPYLTFFGSQTFGYMTSGEYDS